MGSGQVPTGRGAWLYWVSGSREETGAAFQAVNEAIFLFTHGEKATQMTE